MCIRDSILAGALSLLTGALIFAEISNIRSDIFRARDRLFKEAQAEQVLPGFQGVIPASPESGVLLDVRNLLADWLAGPLSQDNFRPTVDQALTFRNVVSGQVTRTDCR